MGKVKEYDYAQDILELDEMVIRNIDWIKRGYEFLTNEGINHALQARDIQTSIIDDAVYEFIKIEIKENGAIEGERLFEKICFKIMLLQSYNANAELYGNSIKKYTKIFSKYNRYSLDEEGNIVEFVKYKWRENND